MGAGNILPRVYKAFDGLASAYSILRNQLKLNKMLRKKSWLSKIPLSMVNTKPITAAIHFCCDKIKSILQNSKMS